MNDFNRKIGRLNQCKAILNLINLPIATSLDIIADARKNIRFIVRCGKVVPSTNDFNFTAASRCHACPDLRQAWILFPLGLWASVGNSWHATRYQLHTRQPFWDEHAIPDIMQPALEDLPHDAIPSLTPLSSVLTADLWHRDCSLCVVSPQTKSLAQIFGSRFTQFPISREKSVKEPTQLRVSMTAKGATSVYCGI